MVFSVTLLSLQPCTSKLNLTSWVRFALFQTARYVDLVTFLSMAILINK
jgi:hypothetical protein